MFYQNEEFYLGEWEDDLKHGEGIYIYLDYSVY